MKAYRFYPAAELQVLQDRYIIQGQSDCKVVQDKASLQTQGRRFLIEVSSVHKQRYRMVHSSP